jgi:peptidyl-prolyl cis-trans isomerase D
VKPLSVVRHEIIANITDETARAAVNEAAERAVLHLREKGGLEAYSNDHGYEWQVELAANRRNPMVPAPVLRRAFELPEPAQGQSIFDYVLTPAGDVQVFELVRVTPGALVALDPAQKDQLKQQITAEYGGMVNSEFQRGLRDSADITVL